MPLFLRCTLLKALSFLYLDKSDDDEGQDGMGCEKGDFFGECPLMACACLAKRSVFGNKVYGFSHM